MQRVCFQLQLKPGHLDAYREAHAAVWPDMLLALKSTGWNNYSIFTRDDGIVLLGDPYTFTKENIGDFDF